MKANEPSLLAQLLCEDLEHGRVNLRIQLLGQLGEENVSSGLFPYDLL